MTDHKDHKHTIAPGASPNTTETGGPAPAVVSPAATAPAATAVLPPIARPSLLAAIDPVVSTIAGTGIAGFEDGPAVGTAEFHHPNSLVFDRSGRLVVIDRFNFRVRRIANGSVITLAGDGESASPVIDGKADTAQLGAPTAVAFNPVTDEIVFCDGDLIRTISAAGELKTIAGSGRKGCVEGVQARARFSNPSGLAVRADGKAIVVADTSNNRIRKIENGIVSTLAGDGTKGSRSGLAANCQFNMPISVAYDSKGNLIVVECAGCRVRIIRDGVVTTLAGADTPGFGDGDALHAKFSSPHHVAVDLATDAVYVCDTDNRRIRKILKGQVSTVCGSGAAGSGDGTGGVAMFSSPMGLALLPGGAGLAVADSVAQVIRFVSLDGKAWPTAAVGGSLTAGSKVTTPDPASEGPPPKLPPNYKAISLKLERENAALKAEIAQLRKACTCGGVASVAAAVVVPPTPKGNATATATATAAAPAATPAPAVTSAPAATDAAPVATAAATTAPVSTPTVVADAVPAGRSRNDTIHVTQPAAAVTATPAFASIAEAPAAAATASPAATAPAS